MRGSGYYSDWQYVGSPPQISHRFPKFEPQVHGGLELHLVSCTQGKTKHGRTQFVQGHSASGAGKPTPPFTLFAELLLGVEDFAVYSGTPCLFADSFPCWARCRPHFPGLATGVFREHQVPLPQRPLSPSAVFPTFPQGSSAVLSNSTFLQPPPRSQL